MNTREMRIAATDVMTGIKTAAADGVMMRGMTTDGGAVVLAPSGVPKIILEKVAAKVGAGAAGEAIDQEK